MGNSQTKEARGSGSGSQESSAGPSGHRNDPNSMQEYAGRSSRREANQRRGSRPDLSSLLGLGNSEPDVSSLEARRESKAEREQRKQEKEKQARLKERQRSMREEGVEGGYLVTMGVYVGVEDFSKPLVRQLMIERRLAPFWRGIDDFSQSWAEHQIMAVARGMPLPPADEVPPELEYQLSKRPFPDVNKSLTVPMGPRSESFHSDSGRASPANGSFSFASTSPQPPTSSSLPFRSRAKTLASLGSASRNNSEKDLAPRELKLPHDPFVNGQPIEVFLYKDAAECPICCLYYPPYLNTTRCCEQAICSECFVQIKRPEPHPREHNDPDPNAPPVPEEERLAQAEGLLVSEVATCPYCKTPEFGITYTPPPFRRGVTYGGGQSYGVMSARSSQTSVASSTLSPGPNRRRGTSLSATAPEVITTDKIRPDWASKLAAARAHAARRSAAASALHAAAYLMNDQGQRPPPGPFGRRGVLRRSTLGDDGRPLDAQMSAFSLLADRHAVLADRAPASAFMAPLPRGSSSRRSRMDDLEDMMMMEAIRLSLAAEEDRRRKEEKDAKKKAKKEEKEQKKAEKAARKHGAPSSPFGLGASDSVSMSRTESNISSIAPDDIGKGKHAERNEPSPSRRRADGQECIGGADSPSLLSPSQESLTAPIGIPTAAEPFRRSHLRQMSNASSASSSFHETGTGTPAVNEPMFNFRSLAAMIDDEEKGDGSSHHEHVEDGTNGDAQHSYDDQDMLSEEEGKDMPESGNPTLRGVTTIDEAHERALNSNRR